MNQNNAIWSFNAAPHKIGGFARIGSGTVGFAGLALTVYGTAVTKRTYRIYLK